MAFHSRKDINPKSLASMLDYTQFLKTEDDPVLRSFKTPEGFYLNITKVDQTPEEEAKSKAVEEFQKIYQSILQEK